MGRRLLQRTPLSLLLALLALVIFLPLAGGAKTIGYGNNMYFNGGLEKSTNWGPYSTTKRVPFCSESYTVTDSSSDAEKEGATKLDKCITACQNNCRNTKKLGATPYRPYCKDTYCPAQKSTWDPNVHGGSAFDSDKCLRECSLLQEDCSSRCIENITITPTFDSNGKLTNSEEFQAALNSCSAMCEVKDPCDMRCSDPNLNEASKPNCSDTCHILRGCYYGADPFSTTPVNIENNEFCTYKTLDFDNCAGTKTKGACRAMCSLFVDETLPGCSQYWEPRVALVGEQVDEISGMQTDEYTIHWNELQPVLTDIVEEGEEQEKAYFPYTRKVYRGSPTNPLGLIQGGYYQGFYAAIDSGSVCMYNAGIGWRWADDPIPAGDKKAMIASLLAVGLLTGIGGLAGSIYAAAHPDEFIDTMLGSSMLRYNQLTFSEDYVKMYLLNGGFAVHPIVPKGTNPKVRGSYDPSGNKAHEYLKEEFNGQTNSRVFEKGKFEGVRSSEYLLSKKLDLLLYAYNTFDQGLSSETIDKLEDIDTFYSTMNPPFSTDEAKNYSNATKNELEDYIKNKITPNLVDLGYLRFASPGSKPRLNETRKDILGDKFYARSDLFSFSDFTTKEKNTSRTVYDGNGTPNDVVFEESDLNKLELCYKLPIPPGPPPCCGTYSAPLPTPEVIRIEAIDVPYVDPVPENISTFLHPRVRISFGSIPGMFADLEWGYPTENGVGTPPKGRGMPVNDGDPSRDGCQEVIDLTGNKREVCPVMRESGSSLCVVEYTSGKLFGCVRRPLDMPNTADSLKIRGSGLEPPSTHELPRMELTLADQIQVFPLTGRSYIDCNMLYGITFCPIKVKHTGMLYNAGDTSLPREAMCLQGYYDTNDDGTFSPHTLTDPITSANLPYGLCVPIPPGPCQELGATSATQFASFEETSIESKDMVEQTGICATGYRAPQSSPIVEDETTGIISAWVGGNTPTLTCRAVGASDTSVALWDRANTTNYDVQNGCTPIRCPAQNSKDSIAHSNDPAYDIAWNQTDAATNPSEPSNGTINEINGLVCQDKNYRPKAILDQNTGNITSYINPSRTCDALGNWSDIKNPCEPKKCNAIDTSKPNYVTAFNGYAAWDEESASAQPFTATACADGYTFRKDTNGNDILPERNCIGDVNGSHWNRVKAGTECVRICQASGYPTVSFKPEGTTEENTQYLPCTGNSQSATGDNDKGSYRICTANGYSDEVSSCIRASCPSVSYQDPNSNYNFSIPETDYKDVDGNIIAEKDRTIEFKRCPDDITKLPPFLQKTCCDSTSATNITARCIEEDGVIKWSFSKFLKKDLSTDNDFNNNNSEPTMEEVLGNCACRSETDKKYNCMPWEYVTINASIRRITDFNSKCSWPTVNVPRGLVSGAGPIENDKYAAKLENKLPNYPYEIPANIWGWRKANCKTYLNSDSSTEIRTIPVFRQCNQRGKWEDRPTALIDYTREDYSTGMAFQRCNTFSDTTANLASKRNQTQNQPNLVLDFKSKLVNFQYRYYQSWYAGAQDLYGSAGYTINPPCWISGWYVHRHYGYLAVEAPYQADFTSNKAYSYWMNGDTNKNSAPFYPDCRKITESHGITDHRDTAKDPSP